MGTVPLGELVRGPTSNAVLRLVWLGAYPGPNPFLCLLFALGVLTPRNCLESLCVLHVGQLFVLAANAGFTDLPCAAQTPGPPLPSRRTCLSPPPCAPEQGLQPSWEIGRGWRDSPVPPPHKQDPLSQPGKFRESREVTLRWGFAVFTPYTVNTALPRLLKVKWRIQTPPEASRTPQTSFKNPARGSCLNPTSAWGLRG